MPEIKATGFASFCLYCPYNHIKFISKIHNERMLLKKIEEKLVRINNLETIGFQEIPVHEDFEIHRTI